MGFLRRVRGIFGQALLWATSWGAAFGLIGAILHLTGIIPVPFFEFLGPFVRGAATAGFIGGAGFSLLLSSVYRNRKVEDLNPVWFGGLGALCGMAFPLFQFLEGGAPLGLVLGVTGACTVLGASVSFGALKLAQRAPALTETVENPRLAEEAG